MPIDVQKPSLQSSRLAKNARLRCTGTALEGTEPDIHVYFKERVLPLLELRRDLWPKGAWCASTSLTYKFISFSLDTNNMMQGSSSYTKVWFVNE